MSDFHTKLKTARQHGLLLQDKLCPAQLVADMRNAKNKSNERMFTRAEWMTKSQVQSFFSRLAATCRKDQGVIRLSADQEEDTCNSCRKIPTNGILLYMVSREINVSHPICYPVHLTAVASFEKLGGTNAPGPVHSKGFLGGGGVGGMFLRKIF